MANLFGLFFKILFIASSLVLMLTNAKDCPASNKVIGCTPRCYKDSDCSNIGGKCCPNLCNERSCVAPHLLTNSDSSNTRPNKYGVGSSNTVYCGNVKCTAFERCETDRRTKKQKCVRA